MQSEPTRTPVQSRPRASAGRRGGTNPASPRGLRTGVVCSVSSRPDGGTEVVVRLSAEQWLVTTITGDCCASRGLLVGQSVLIDPATTPFRIVPPQQREHD